jgi:hypothetical protein
VVILKVFISHSTKDFQIVAILQKYLESRGISVYIAEHDYKPGTPLSQKIINNLNDSDYFLVIYTKNGNESVYVNHEIGFWIKKRQYENFIPLVEKGLIPQGFLAGIEYINYDPSNPQIGLTNAINYLYQKMSEENNNKLWWGAGILTVIGIVTLILIGLSQKNK